MVSGILNAALSICEFLVKAGFFLCFVVFFLSLPFILVYLFHFIRLRFKNRKNRIKKSVKHVKKPLFLKRLIFDFPLRVASDTVQRNPAQFREFGLHMFIGEQGSGKTISAVYFSHLLHLRYPKAQILSNINLTFADSVIESIDDIIFKNNGAFGQVVLIDEIQNWFSSNESKNFPPEMLQEICQQRKQAKALICTAQRFERVSKPIREQINYIYKPITILGALTIIRRYRPSVGSDGELKKLRHDKIFFFVHSDFIRNSYDTYEKVKRLVQGGFKARSDYQDSATIINVTQPPPQVMRPRR